MTKEPSNPDAQNCLDIALLMDGLKYLPPEVQATVKRPVNDAVSKIKTLADVYNISYHLNVNSKHRYSPFEMEAALTQAIVSKLYNIAAGNYDVASYRPQFKEFQEAMERHVEYYHRLTKLLIEHSKTEPENTELNAACDFLAELTPKLDKAKEMIDSWIKNPAFDNGRRSRGNPPTR